MIRELARHVRQYKKLSILTPFLVFCEVLIEIAIPFFIAMLITEVKAGAELSAVLRYGLILAGCAILSLLFGTLAGITASKASNGLARNLRHDMFAHIQKFSFANIDKFAASSLVTRMTTDANFVRFAYMMFIRTAIRAPMMLVFAFIMAFFMGGRMGWIFLFVVPVMGCGLGLVVWKTLPLFRKMFRKYDILNRSIQENVKAIREVKSFVREDYESEKFTAASGELRWDFTKAERTLALINPLMQFCLYVVMVFILTFGSYTVITSRGLALDVGQMSALLTYSFMMLFSLMMLSMVFVMMVMAQESARRIVEVFKEKSTLTSPEDALREVKDGSVTFDHVCFKYSEDAERYALEDINLDIRSGEVIGIVGATGSSKSTLVQLIPRLYDVSRGTVSVGGIDIRRYDLDTLRKNVAMVLQKNVLFSGTIAENLRWGNENATDEDLRAACELAQAHEFISKFPDGYETHIEQGGANVSGGQKQRICIARALLSKPLILILDDSTSAVDTRTDNAIRNGLRSYIPETTKIIIAQRINSVEDADRIIVMDGGRVNAVGTHEALLRENAIYREIYTSQNRKEAETNA